MESLIDPRSTPYSSADEIAAEIEEVRKLPASPERDHTLELLQSWLDERTGGAPMRHVSNHGNQA